MFGSVSLRVSTRVSRWDPMGLLSQALHYCFRHDAHLNTLKISKPAEREKIEMRWKTIWRTTWDFKITLKKASIDFILLFWWFLPHTQQTVYFFFFKLQTVGQYFNCAWSAVTIPNAQHTIRHPTIGCYTSSIRSIRPVVLTYCSCVVLHSVALYQLYWKRLQNA